MAVAGRRRAHFVARSSAPAGRAAIGSRRRKRDEVVGQCCRRCVTPVRVLFKTLQADRLQVAWDARVELRRWRWVVGEHLLQRGRRRLGLERRPSRQAFIQDRPERIDVRRRSNRVFVAPRLLRCHVAGRAQRGARQRQPEAAVLLPRQTKVGHFRRTVGGQQDIGRLEIAVNDAALMRGFDGRLPIRR